LDSESGDLLVEAIAVNAQEKVLTFPEGRSLGVLYDIDESGASSLIGEAQGTVRIGAGRQIELKLNTGSSGDLTPLAAVDPDALHVISL